MKLYKTIRETYKLNAQSIDKISESVSLFLKQIGRDDKSMLRLRLSVEEVLLKWDDFFGEEKNVLLQCGKRLGKPYIRLEVAGEKYNPLENETGSDWLGRLLTDMNSTPAFSYTGQKNVITFYPPKKEMGMLPRFGVAVVLAVIVGLAGEFFTPEFRNVVAETLFTPLSDTFFGLIGMLAGPLIFLSVFTGICGIGDAATFEKTGKKVVAGAAGMTAAAAVVSLGISLLVFQVEYSSGGVSGTVLGDIVDLLLGIFPSNIVDSFLTGNSIQIIVLSCGFGVASLIVGSRMKEILNACEQGRTAIGVIMGWLEKLMPVLFFIILVQNIWTETLSVVIHGWKPILMIIALLGLTFGLHVLYVCIKTKTNIIVFTKKIMPGFMIGLTTASSSGSLGEMTTSCRNRLGVDKSITQFALPMGLVLSGAVTAIEFAVLLIYSVQFYHIAISYIWIITGVVTVFFLAIATPPVPGAVLGCFTMLFLQMGIPQEAVAVALAFDVILDFPCTAVKVGMIQCEAVRVAYQCDLCDTEQLRK